MERGPARRPETSGDDIFFDLEGDLSVSSTGREYVFGLVAGDGRQLTYSRQWALNPAEEKQAFESFVDQAMARATRLSRAALEVNAIPRK